MASLYEWNSGLAWWFADREEADQRTSRLSLTLPVLYEIGDRLGVSRKDCLEDFVSSMFDSQDDYYNQFLADYVKMKGNPRAVLRYGAALALKYMSWISDDVPTPDDEKYPDIVPPFLSHLAFCTLALNMVEGGSEIQVYPRIAELLMEILPDRFPNGTGGAEIKRLAGTVQGHYSDLHGYPKGLSAISIQAPDGAPWENIWKHVGRWSRDRAEDRGSGGIIQTVAARYGAGGRVWPIRYAAQIRPYDESIFQEIATRLRHDFAPSRHQMRARIHERRNDFRSGVKGLIEKGLFEGLVDHGIQTWALVAAGYYPGSQEAVAAGVEVRYQLEPYLWINEEAVQYASIRVRHIKGKADDEKLVLEGDGFSHEIEAPKAGGVSDAIPGDDEVKTGRIWRGEFELVGHGTGEPYGFNSITEWLRVSTLLLVPDHHGMWHPGEPVVTQRSAWLRGTSDAGDPLLTNLNGGGVSLVMRGAAAGTEVQASETKVSFAGGLKLPTGHYLRRAPPVLRVTRGSPEHVDLYPLENTGHDKGEVDWRESLVEQPGQAVEGAWKFVPRDDVDRIRIEYKIGRDYPVTKEIAVTDGVDLWMEYEPEVGRVEGA